MSILLKSLRYSEYEGDDMGDNSELVEFNDSLQKDDLKQRILLLHNLINKHIQRHFAKRHLPVVLPSSSAISSSPLGVTMDDEEVIDHLFDEARTNIENWHDAEVEESMSFVASIDPQLLLDTSRTDKSMIPDLEGDRDPLITVHDFVNAFSTIISQEMIKERKIAIELVGGKPFHLSKGIQGQLALLPPGRELLTKNPENMIDLCIVYDNAMNLFLKKDSKAVFVRQVVQASFMKLIVELLSVFSTRWLNVWDFAVLPFEAKSFGLKLRDIIDMEVEEWRSAPATDRILRISAKEILGDQYDSNFHLDVELDGRNRFRFNDLNDIKSRMLWQIM